MKEEEGEKMIPQSSLTQVQFKGTRGGEKVMKSRVLRLVSQGHRAGLVFEWNGGMWHCMVIWLRCGNMTPAVGYRANHGELPRFECVSMDTRVQIPLMLGVTMPKKGGDLETAEGGFDSSWCQCYIDDF